MAKPIRLASRIITLATFIFQCSVTLYETVDSFCSHLKCVYDLLNELEALGAMLAPLIDLVKSNLGVDLLSLDLPLLQYRNIYKEFQ